MSVTNKVISTTFWSTFAKRFLFPRQVEHSQQCGFKVKSFLKLRCKHCYFVRVNGRLHVECNGSPRHQAREPFDVKKLW